MSDSDGDSVDDDTEDAWREVFPNDDLDILVFTQKLFNKRFPIKTRLDDDTFFTIYLTEQHSRADLIRLAPHAHTREGRFNADYQSPILGDDLFTPPTASLPSKCNSMSRKRRHSTVSLPPPQFSLPKRLCHDRKTEATSSVATLSDIQFSIQQMKASLAALESEVLLRSDDTTIQWRQSLPSSQPVRKPSFNPETEAGPSRYRQFDNIGAPSSPPRMEDDMVFLGSDVLNAPAITHGLPSVGSDASFWLSEGDVRPNGQSSSMGEDLAPYDFGAAPYHSYTLHELLADETPGRKANRLVEMFGGAEGDEDWDY
ncbi:hypothetical protein H2201_007030 [Coniosporium apollinis]|uniref:Uncharacterized protein n=1 Tax=Coniosporium apollinis TaxID=61459 RepID=A0ABQ9NK11_9PEZI|nr:hypothetical protein H2201_007030 [Coniosporium apollinis]